MRRRKTMKKRLSVISLMLAVLMLFSSCALSYANNQNAIPPAEVLSPSDTTPKENVITPTTPSDSNEDPSQNNNNNNNNNQPSGELEFTSFGDGTCAVSSIGSYTGKEIIIPEKSPAGDKVVAIADCAFAYCFDIKSVYIPDGVTSIGVCAFGACINLLDVRLPKTLEKIDMGAFCICLSLISIDIPDSVSTIGVQAFMASARLCQVKLGSGIVEIDEEAFAYCNILELYDPLELISKYFLYSDVKRYSSRDFESKIRIDGDYIVYSDKEADEYYLVGYLGNDIQITLPDNIDGHDYVIRANAFANFIEYEYSGLNNLSNLVSITIPKGVSAIQQYAFSGCYNLTEIYNLSDVEISNEPYTNGYISTDYVYTDPNEPSKIVTSGEFIFLKENLDGDLHYTLLASTEMTKDLVLPDSIDGYGYDVAGMAFYQRSDIESVTISDNTKIIGNEAFAFCKSLRKVDLGQGLERIESSAFRSCPSLYSLTIPESVTSIGVSAFAYCHKLYEVYNLSSVTLLSVENEFEPYVPYAKNIFTSLESESKMIEKDGFVFYDDRDGDSGSYLLIGYNANDAKIVLPSDINGEIYRIGNYAFHKNYSVKEVVIPEPISYIGDYAFDECVKLRSVEAPSTLNFIGKNAFSECYCLKNAPTVEAE